DATARVRRALPRLRRRPLVRPPARSRRARRRERGGSPRRSRGRAGGTMSRIADGRDLVCRRRLQLLDRLGLNRGWFRELSEYYRGITRQEFWVRYTIGRMEAAKLWAKKPRRTEGDY